MPELRPDRRSRNEDRRHGSPAAALRRCGVLPLRRAAGIWRRHGDPVALERGADAARRGPPRSAAQGKGGSRPNVEELLTDVMNPQIRSASIAPKNGAQLVAMVAGGPPDLFRSIQ